MNIFIMILVALFMVGYYWIDSPSQNIAQHDTEYAIERSDLRTIAQCAVAVHNAQINGTEFQDVCIEQSQINSQFVCMDKKLKITKCAVVRNQKPAFSYIVTATQPLDAENYNSMMEILEQHYADSGTFGLFQDNQIMSGGTATKRVVPAAVVKEMDLKNGQLVYLTQYEIPDMGTQYDAVGVADVVCPVGTAKTYRFGRWQCIGYNTQTDCGGDMIWDSDLYECVADESRKPLCADSQTAVLVDSVWECIDPFPEKSCPDKMVARLNYNTLEWECVIDPNSITDTKKCGHIVSGMASGTLGTTLRIPQTSCTDCERMITDPDTCTTSCVPDPSKIGDARCYAAAAANQCSGPSRAFYFGFPNKAYIGAVDAVANVAVPLDKAHSQNRKFNCLDCGEGVIDATRSVPPYVAVCK